MSKAVTIPPLVTSSLVLLTTYEVLMSPLLTSVRMKDQNQTTIRVSRYSDGLSLSPGKESAISLIGKIMSNDRPSAHLD